MKYKPFECILCAHSRAVFSFCKCLRCEWDTRKAPIWFIVLDIFHTIKWAFHQLCTVGRLQAEFCNSSYNPIWCNFNNAMHEWTTIVRLTNYLDLIHVRCINLCCAQNVPALKYQIIKCMARAKFHLRVQNLIQKPLNAFTHPTAEYVEHLSGTAHSSTILMFDAEKETHAQCHIVKNANASWHSVIKLIY